MLWSILIAAVPERYHLVQPLLYSLLEAQAVGRMSDIELLYLLDNKRRPVGAKRNALLSISNGQYISFIDDDDMVADDYVRRIHDALLQAKRQDKEVDVVCFGQRATLAPHGIIHECTYSLAYYRDREPDKRRQLAPAHDQSGKVLTNTLNWTGPPAHTMIWRRALLDGIRFPEQQFGEDVAFVDLACANAKSELQLNGDPLYFYRFNAETTSTR